MSVRVGGQVGTEPPAFRRQPRSFVLLASGIGSGGGIFRLGDGGSKRLSDVPTTGLVSWDNGSRLATIEWSDEDPAPATSYLDRRNGPRSEGATDVPVREPHALCWRRGLLYAVSTADNSILSLDARGRVHERWQAPGDGDCWHLNSLTIKDGRLLASAFGRFDHHRGWAEGDRRHEAGIVFELCSGREVLSGLSCPHDPTFVDDTWIVCNSAERTVVRFDRDGTELERVELGGWTRGLAWDANSLYVGVSAHRMLGDEGRARVVRLDRRHLEPVDEWELPCPEVFALSWVTPEVAAGYRPTSTCLPGRESAPLAAQE